jgi:dipeptidyl aminopeptidase/acylaminoacyl peptidase
MTEKRKIAAEDLYRIQTPGSPRLSPDGSKVVFLLQRVDQTTQKKYSNLFMVSVKDSVQKQFTFGDQSDSAPQWSPDGKTIAFLSNRGDKEKPAQIYLLPVAGGEANPLTSFEGAITDFQWSPDGKKILFGGFKFDAEVIERQKDENRKKLGVVERHITRLVYKLDGFGFLPKERAHLWIIDTATRELQQLTDYEVFDETDGAWSPDGSRIVFVSNRQPDPDMDPYSMDIYTIPAAGGELSKLPAPRGTKHAPAYSPDGRHVAWFGAEDEGKMYENMDVWIAPADGSKTAKNLTEKYEWDCDHGVINDLGGAESFAPAWSKDSQFLYFKTAEKGNGLLKKINIKTGEISQILGPTGDVGSLSFDREQKTFSYTCGNLYDPGQINIYDMKSGESRQLTSVNKDLFAEISMSKVEEVWFKSPGGSDLQGWIMFPPDFDAAKQYPSILEIHGGPWAMYGNLMMHEFNYLAAQGYVVFFSNPRGGTGYGTAHAKAITNNWGGPSMDDLMAFTDLVAERPYIDKTRIGVTGGSYGGYMTNWIIGHTQRYKAAVTQRCVSNLISMWGSSDMGFIFEQEFGNVPPFESIEGLWNNSPVKYLGNAKTPTLVIHNEMDLRCAIEQGEQVFVALKRLGVETEMVRFPEEPHGLSRMGRTDRRIARLNHILRWFEKYLK